MIDVVGLVLAVVAQDRFIFHRVERVDDRLERFVLDLDQLGGVGAASRVFRNDAGDFLVLEQRLADGEHHLLVVPVERRDPAKPGRSRSLPVITALTPGTASAAVMSMLLDARVRIRAVHERQVQHVRQRDVVDEASAALDEARIFLALHRDADGVSRGGGAIVVVLIAHFAVTAAGAIRRPPAARP